MYDYDMFYGSVKVDFPAVTICSPGINEVILNAGFLKLFFAFLANNNVNMTLSPLEASTLLLAVSLQ